MRLPVSYTPPGGVMLCGSRSPVGSLTRIWTPRASPGPRLLSVALMMMRPPATTGSGFIPGASVRFGAATGATELSLMRATPSASTLAVLFSVSPGATLVLTRTRTE